MSWRRHTLKILAVTLPVLILAGLWAWVKFLEAARWRELEQRVAGLRVQVAADRQARGPVRQETDPGDAWEEYAAAVAPLVNANAFAQLRELFDGKEPPIPGIPAKSGPRLPPPTPEEAVAILAPYSESLRHLRKGTRRIPGSRPAEFRFNPQSRPNFLMSERFLTSLAFWESRRLGEAGQADDASDLLIDIMIFSADRARGEGHSEVYLAGLDWERSQRELRDLLLRRALSRLALASIQHDLQALDGSLYSQAAYLRRRLLPIGDQILREGAYISGYDDLSRDQKPFPGQESWRFGFSSRLTSASAFLWMDSWVARLSEVDSLSWKAIRDMRPEFGGYIDDTRNPVASQFDVMFSPESVRDKRTIQARLRLLRALAASLQTGSVPDIADPYGDKLRYAEKAGVLRIWSLGTDGEDQGGEGGWEHPYEKDLVVELRR